MMKERNLVKLRLLRVQVMLQLRVKALQIYNFGKDLKCQVRTIWA